MPPPSLNLFHSSFSVSNPYMETYPTRNDARTAAATHENERGIIPSLIAAAERTAHSKNDTVRAHSFVGIFMYPFVSCTIMLTPNASAVRHAEASPTLFISIFKIIFCRSLPVFYPAHNKSLAAESAEI